MNDVASSPLVQRYRMNKNIKAEIKPFFRLEFLSGYVTALARAIKFIFIPININRKHGALAQSKH